MSRAASSRHARKSGARSRRAKAEATPPWPKWKRGQAPWRRAQVRTAGSRAPTVSAARVARVAADAAVAVAPIAASAN